MEARCREVFYSRWSDVAVLDVDGPWPSSADGYDAIAALILSVRCDFTLCCVFGTYDKCPPQPSSKTSERTLSWLFVKAYLIGQLSSYADPEATGVG